MFPVFLVPSVNPVSKNLNTRGVVYLVAALLVASNAGAGEICRFAGTSDYSGRVALTAVSGTDAGDGTTTVDVAGQFTDTPMPFVHVKYLMEEISTWKSGQLAILAVNTRYLIDGRVVRQLWDVFRRVPDGLEAYRLEGSPREFRRTRPAFARHWDPATFGQPWLEDFWASHPDRRRDLDFQGASMRTPLRSPLALAFYWSRRLPPGGETVTVFLPGFKKDKSVDLTIVPGRVPRDGSRPWHTGVRYPALSLRRDSTATAWVSPDGHLLQLAVQVVRSGRMGSGVIRQQGCGPAP